MKRLALFTLVGFLFAGAESSVAHAQKKAPAADDPHALSLEVVALQSLRRLDLTPAQLENLLRLSKGAASNVKPQGSIKITPAFVKSLKALRDALLADDERVDELKEKLVEIMDKDRIQLDDRVPISESARRQATQVIRSLSPAQVLAYLQVLDDDDVDVLEILETALARGKAADAGQWKAIRDSAAAEAAWLIAGSNESRANSAVKNVALILDQHHNAKGGKNALPDLDKMVKQWTGHLDPFEILRHAMERELAELLSNPRLPQAIQHTLEQRRK